MLFECHCSPKSQTPSFPCIIFIQWRYLAGGAASGGACVASSACNCLCIRILVASVPSSGVAASLNQGCWSACLAVILSAGS
jgi:hypothetical protein